MGLFKRPHICACDDYVDIAVDLSFIRRLADFSQFKDEIRGELQDIYGVAPSDFHSGIMYSTQEFPNRFCVSFTEQQLDAIRKYDAHVEKAKQLAAEHTAAVEEHARAVEEVGDRKLTRRQRKEEEKTQRRLKAMSRETNEAEYAVLCDSQGLKNLFAMEAIRVPLH